MQFDPTTFCAAPWFQIRNDNDGSYRVCCNIDHSKSSYTDNKHFAWPEQQFGEFFNSGYVHYLRQHLTNGVRLPECGTCWKAESLGQTSLRQTVNNSCTRNHGHELTKTWIGPFMKHHKDFNNDLVVSADIKLTNMCNFSCVMCNSNSSSQIYAQWKRDANHEAVRLRLGKDAKSRLDKTKNIFIQKSNYELLTELLTLQPKNLKILGGEPLLDEQCLDILSAVPASQQQDTALCFTTNGSQDLGKTYRRLSGYLSVDFVVSLDGIGPVQDYIRKGSDWEQIEKNIDQFLADYPGHLSVHHTSQALNVHVLPDLMRWCQARNVRSSIFFLSEPGFMGYTAIPEKLKKQIVDCLCRYDYHTTVSAALTVLKDSCWIPEHTKQLNTYLDWYDPKNTRRDIFHDWRPYF